MMTIQEMKTGYEEEVAYQKHMLKNLGYWIQLGTVTSGIGIVISYLYPRIVKSSATLSTYS